MTRWARSRVPSVETAGAIRTNVVGSAAGATHIHVDVLTLPPGASAPFVTRFAESALAVLSGSVTIGGVEGGALGPGGWAHIPVGVPVGVSNASDEPAQLIETVCPQPRPSALLPDEVASGHVKDGHPSQDVRSGNVDPEASLPPSPVPEFAVGNIDGASATSLVNAASGADHLVLLVIEYAVGGWMNPHDHPFEEAYVFLTGEMEGTLDGQAERFRSGDVLWTGVGNVHGFTNVGDSPARWLEVQSPLPPPRFAARFASGWQ